ncbi:MAG: SDR family oxidoreductase [Roseomonas sp.]|nr:SDR family oxidoreductase [Roseomonas sp.]
MSRFNGAAMITTGAARGIGAATARLAAAEGARLLLTDIIADELEALRASIVSAGGTARAMVVDASSEAGADAMVADCVAAYGRLDVAVNNAGIMQPEVATVSEASLEMWQRVMAVNLTGVFLCCRAELRQMVAQGGGVIVNMASIGGITGLNGAPAYAASKHGVVGLTRSIALDYARHGIRCNAICPSGTDTPMVEQAGRLVESYIGDRMKTNPGLDANSLTPAKIQGLLGRNATPEEQAEGILWLASSQSSFVTGITLPVDGGWTAF